MTCSRVEECIFEDGHAEPLCAVDLIDPQPADYSLAAGNPACCGSNACSFYMIAMDNGAGGVARLQQCIECGAKFTSLIPVA